MVAIREIALALRELARTTLLFKVRGQRGVSRATWRAMRAQVAAEAAPPTARSQIARGLRAVNRAERVWPLPVACLQRALVLHAVLRSGGTASIVRIGSRLDDDRLTAHAWVEAGGCVLDERGEASEFVPFRVPAHGQDDSVGGSGSSRA